MHHVAAVGDASVATQLSYDGNGRAGEADIHGAVPRREVLTYPAPAHACNQGFGRASIAHRPTQTTAMNVHHLLSWFRELTPVYRAVFTVPATGNAGQATQQGALRCKKYAWTCRVGHLFFTER